MIHANMSNKNYGEPNVSSIEREIEFDGNESTIIEQWLKFILLCPTMFILGVPSG